MSTRPKPKLAESLAAAITAAAAEFSLPESLLIAIVLTESAGKSVATRYEPNYRYLVNAANKGAPFRVLTAAEAKLPTPPGDFLGTPQTSPEAEWRGQKTSWGPMQIMGAVAREYGYTGKFGALNGPLGVHYGALHLARGRDRFLAGNGWDGVVAAYNGGSPRRDRQNPTIWFNQRYVDTVAQNGAHFESYPV